MTIGPIFEGVLEDGSKVYTIGPMALSSTELDALGVLTPKKLLAHADQEPPWLVEDLFQQGTVNLLVGDSGLGKTPLVVQLGISVAAGIPFLGRPTVKGPVLFADFESSAKTFSDTSADVAKFLGLPEVPPDFLVWSPEWKKPATDVYKTELIHRVERIQPTLVIVDPLRLFDPDAPVKNEDAAKLFKQIRRTTVRTTWLILHHCRKVGASDQFQEESLVENPRGWLMAASGARALINHTDTRLGVNETEARKAKADLVISGFIRGKTTLHPSYLVRGYNEHNEPVGYRLRAGMDLLTAEQSITYKSLGDTFVTKEVRAALGGNSHSKADLFLRKLQGLGLARRIAQGVYLKTPNSED